MAAHFIIAGDFAHKRGVTTNYYQHSSPFFTAWTSDPGKAAPFNTRRLALAQVKRMQHRSNTRIVKYAPEDAGLLEE